MYLNSLLCASAFPFMGQSYAAELAGQRPNILLVVTDLQNIDMISALRMGDGKYISTPNFDRLVNKGYTFTNTYCANPLSLPSRSALFTGTSPAQFGIRNNNVEKKYMDRVLKMVEERSMGHVFGRGGYDTYYAGKVHLPFSDIAHKETFEKRYGFEYLSTDEREGLSQVGADFIRNHQSEKPYLLVLSFINPHDICFVMPSKVIPSFEQAFERHPDIKVTVDSLNRVADAMPVGFFDTDASAPLPKNLQPTTNSIYGTTRIVANKTDSEWRRYVWMYHRMVEIVDAQIGQVLDALEASPQKDNTIVVMTSDHGEMGGSHQMIGKNIQYEEAQRVPLIFVGKGIKHKIDSKSMICNGWDLLPTLCKLAAIDDTPTYEGLSLDEVIKGGNLQQKRDYIYSESHQSFQILKNGRYKYTMRESAGLPCMFTDLKVDPFEVTNMIDDVKYHDLVIELKETLDKELKQRNIVLDENGDNLLRSSSRRNI